MSRLGTDTLAGISAVFPITTLLIAITTLGMGGAVASAIARSLGGGNREEAEALAMHAIMLAVIFGVLTAVILIGLGPQIYAALGARAKRSTRPSLTPISCLAVPSWFGCSAVSPPSSAAPATCERPRELPSIARPSPCR